MAGHDRPRHDRLPDANAHRDARASFRAVAGWAHPGRGPHRAGGGRVNPGAGSARAAPGRTPATGAEGADPARAENEAARTAEQTAARTVAATGEAFPDKPPGDAPAAAVAGEHDPHVPGGETAQPRPAGPGGGAAPEAGKQDKGNGDGTVELQLPKFPDESAEEFAGLVVADGQGQRGLQAAVTKALADVATMMAGESAKVDTDLATAEKTITAATDAAREKVQGAAATARARVERARAEQGTRVTSQLDRKKSTARTDVEEVAHQIEDVGSRRADEAQKVGTDAADELERTRNQRMGDARRTGTDRAARAVS